MSRRGLVGAVVANLIFWGFIGGAALTNGWLVVAALLLLFVVVIGGVGYSFTAEIE